MLEIRPNCELCDVDLPANAVNARICTYECTFCADCADGILCNVCPNCGGGLAPRPIRPAKAYRPGLGLMHHPASTKRVMSPHDRAAIDDIVRAVKDIAPQDR
ncbi:MAG: DUF1272 domain-containing protein [Pseudomonadota bacterium]